MSRTRSLSTSSLPGNIMASWSIHSYPASQVEDTVEDSPSNTPYPSTKELTYKGMTRDMLSLGIQTSDTATLTHDFVPPSSQYTGPFVPVDARIAQNIQLPSSTDQQTSTLPMGDPPYTQLPTSDFVAGADRALNSPISPLFTPLSGFNVPSLDTVTCNSNWIAILQDLYSPEPSSTDLNPNVFLDYPVSPPKPHVDIQTYRRCVACSILDLNPHNT